MFRLKGVLLVLVLICPLVAETDSGIIDSDNRSMFNIVWGCISTTILCAWAAIHPNIPPREGPLKQILRRLELMFWTIVAPEILPSWALNQLLAAKTVRNVYNEGKGYTRKRREPWEIVKGWVSLKEIKEVADPAWTVAHGHFLIMGGFHLVELPEVQLAEVNPDADTSSLLVEVRDTETESGHGLSEKKPESRVTILTLDLLRNLVNDPAFEIHTTEEEILDKSKGDALSKLIFILQSTWFILQCIARRVQGLNLTHLELAVLALASLNGITFALWWDKPLGAEVIIRVYLKRKLTESERAPQDTRSARSIFIRGIPDLFKEYIRDAFRCQSSAFFRIPFAILVLLLSPIIIFTATFLATVIDLIQESSSFPPDDTHVPTFYVPKHRYPKWCHIVLLLSLGVVFGGIHCFGWNFSFPTHAEQKLWRVASLAVTIIPIFLSSFALIILSMDGCLPSAFVEYLSVVTLLLCALAYMSARLVLLGLASALLRDLPPRAFIAVSWTKFFPHFFSSM